MGQQDEENPTHLCSSLNLVSDCPKHYYKTFSAHHNGSEVPSTLRLNSGKAGINNPGTKNESFNI